MVTKPTYEELLQQVGTLRLAVERQRENEEGLAETI